jgi:hypothetical protein
MVSAGREHLPWPDGALCLTVMHPRRALVVLIATAPVLAGCAAGGGSALAPVGVGFTEPPDLAAMSDKVQTVFTTVKLTGYPRVSRVRPAPVTAPTDWMVCLRSDAENDPRSYALFIRGNEVVDWRLALMIDQCATETYGALPVPMPVK